MSKVQVSAEVAAVLDYGKTVFTKGYIIEVTEAKSWPADGVMSPLNEVDALSVAEMLFKGYEVEDSPEVKIRTAFTEAEQRVKERASSAYHHGLRDGIKLTLGYFGKLYILEEGYGYPQPELPSVEVPEEELPVEELPVEEVPVEQPIETYPEEELPLRPEVSE